MKDNKQPENCYLIRVGGTLDPKWDNYFHNFSLHAQGEGWTLLRGNSADQSVLLGALEKLHSLGLELEFALKTTHQRADQLSSESELDQTLLL